MSREWKPGDVAVNVKHGYRGIFVSDCGSHPVASGTSHWHNESGLFDDSSDIRRLLVVIDPEDREQVERLARVTHIALTGDVPAWSTLSGKDQVRRMDALTMALDAELAPPQPPKPEEPTGLGAVVEDVRGVRFVRTESALGIRNPWSSALHPKVADEIETLPYADIDAVKVLSPGWSE